MLVVYIIISLIVFYLLIGIFSLLGMDFLKNVEESYCILIVIVIGCLISIDQRIKELSRNKKD
ncbi:hypothetical protein DUZ99_00840 [Xylanibacillus composti]|uniref:Uncharacterized protein n=1 Tax=Xylanibacillus composti TaxID=1572762 RepID=A0A8J4H019_9BACL|nr:hypothetical protein [Xylanibacillus composti]GIQ68398.1 hypothetical protein XYCOK13_12220 [Xylanibacillus composti]